MSEWQEIATIQPITQPERKRFWFRTTVSLELLKRWPIGAGTLEDFLLFGSSFHGHAPHVDVVTIGATDSDNAVEVTLFGEANFFPGLT